MQHENAVIFVGNTGVGKSTVCNHIFQVAGVPTRFDSSSQNYAVTTELQQGRISYDAKLLTIMDNPGFFDNSQGAGGAPGTPNQGNDGPNMCKLVKALEACRSIYAVVFVYTDRFHVGHKIWYDRIKALLAEGTSTNGLKPNIVLLHNKLGTATDLDRGRNLGQISAILGEEQVEYVWFSFNGTTPDAGQVQALLAAATRHAPFKLDKMTVPDVCYERELLEDPYVQVISSETKDEGQMVQESREEIVYEKTTRPGLNPAVLAIPVLNVLSLLVPGLHGEQTTETPTVKTLTDSVWKPNMVTRRVLAEMQRRFKVRFDGSKDLVETKELRRWEERI